LPTSGCAGDAPTDEVILFWAKAGLTVVAPLPDDIFRIVAPVAEAPEQPSAAFVQQILDERGLGAGRMVVTEVIWGSRFRIHHRVADTYRSGACCWPATPPTCTARQEVRA